MKRVLVLCTGNSCRSIIAEALINVKLSGVLAFSAGVKASLQVNPFAKKVLQEHGIWKEQYHSKTLDSMRDNKYDLVVTVCDHAKETCPLFQGSTKKLHVSFEDPDGKGYEAFEEIYKTMEKTLLLKVREILYNKR